MKLTVLIIVIGAFGKNLRKNYKRIRKLLNKTRSGDHPDLSIIKIIPNTEKSPGDLRKLADTQIPLENRQ